MKWSVSTGARGLPIGWAIDGANRNDVTLLGPTLDDVAAAGLLGEIETLHLDRGFDNPKIQTRLAGLSLGDLDIQRRSKSGHTTPKQPLGRGRRRVVEGTSSWFSNYGQLRRNADPFNQIGRAHV